MACCVVGTGLLRVVGMPGMPTQYHVFFVIPPQEVPTDGFQEIKSACENVPKMLAMNAHLSEPVA